MRESWAMERKEADLQEMLVMDLNHLNLCRKGMYARWNKKVKKDELTTEIVMQMNLRIWLSSPGIKTGINHWEVIGNNFKTDRAWHWVKRLKLQISENQKRKHWCCRAGAPEVARMEKELLSAKDRW